jgi:hypothetical protein
MTKKAAAEARKKATEERREHAVQVIAGIEKRVTEKNAVDVTPQLGNKYSRHSQHTQASYHDPPTPSDAAIDVPSNTESEPAAENPSEIGDLTDSDARPKKKTKSKKSSFRDSVERLLNERVGDELWQAGEPGQEPPPHHGDRTMTSELSVPPGQGGFSDDELVR